jgi:hypothetical protein
MAEKHKMLAMRADDHSSVLANVEELLTMIECLQASVTLLREGVSPVEVVADEPKHLGANMRRPTGSITLDVAIQQLIERYGQARLAQRVGVSTSHIGRLARNEKNPSPALLARLGLVEVRRLYKWRA